MAENEQKKDWQEVAEKELEKEEQVEQPEIQEAYVLEHPSYKQLEAKLLEAETMAHDQKDKAMRALAELENMRTRSRIDVENAHKFGQERLVKELLPIVDSLEKGLEMNNDEGMQLTLKMLLDVLKKFSVEQLNPLGEVFDPNLHEAMTLQEDEKAESNTILMVVQKGYLLNGRIVRPARVIVAK